MTSAIGDELLYRLRSRHSAQGQRPRRDGFTLVEIMVVMAILVMLFALVALSIASYINKASRAATIARLHRLVQYMDNYKSLTGSYPPDGIDTPVKNDEGVYIKGSACLYYFLTRPVRMTEVVGGKKTIREDPPVGEFKGSELSKENPECQGVREILDGWDTPFHYDNTENGEFHAQGGDVHCPVVDDEVHPSDPRDGDFVVDGQNAVEKPGIQRSGYDIWSHGESGHDVDSKPSMPFATWNLE